MHAATAATETAPIATILPHEELMLDAPQARSCGQPAVGVEVLVLDLDDGSPARPGVVGEVAIRGDNVMAGYWNKPRETAEALTSGWYRTGDLGYMDDHSFLYLVDRAQGHDRWSGGENVYSTEVEEALYGHPAVLEAAVFGIPDERWGEVVHAVVVLRADVSEELQSCPAHCREQIAGLQGPQADRAAHRPAAEVRRGQGAQARAARAALEGSRGDDRRSVDPSRVRPPSPTRPRPARRSSARPARRAAL